MAAVDAAPLGDLDAALLEALVTDPSWPAAPAAPSPWIEPTPAGTGALVPCASPRAGSALPLLCALPPPPPPSAAAVAGADAANNCDLLDALFGDDPPPVPEDGLASPDPKRRRADGSLLHPASSGPLTPVGLHGPRAPSASPGGAGAGSRRRRPTRLLPFSLVPGGGRPATGGAAPALADLNARLRAAATASARAAAAAAAAAVGSPQDDASPATPQAATARAPATPATPSGAAAAAVRPTLLCGPGASPAASIRVSRVASCALGPPAP